MNDWKEQINVCSACHREDQPSQGGDGSCQSPEVSQMCLHATYSLSTHYIKNEADT